MQDSILPALPSCAFLCYAGFHIFLLCYVLWLAQHLDAQLCALCGMPSTCPAGTGRVCAATSIWLLTIHTAINPQYMRYASADIKLSRLHLGNNLEVSNEMHSTAFA